MKHTLDMHDAIGASLMPEQHHQEVCEHCIGDEELAAAISRHEHLAGDCSFCEAAGAHGTSVYSLFVYMGLY